MNIIKGLALQTTRPLKSAIWMAATILLPVVAMGADAPKNENGAVQFYLDYGASFGLPANRAVVLVGSTSAISPQKNTLYAPGFGVAVTAWKCLVPFVDVTAYDTGTATATVGTVTAKLTDKNTVTTNLGLRVVRGKSKLRGYAEFGGGWLYQNVQADLTIKGVTSSQTISGSAGEFMYGAGAQYFISPRLGVDVGFDGFRLAQQLTTGGQNFSRARFGVFFQTKSTAQ